MHKGAVWHRAWSRCRARRTPCTRPPSRSATSCCSRRPPGRCTCAWPSTTRPPGTGTPRGRAGARPERPRLGGWAAPQGLHVEPGGMFAGGLYLAVADKPCWWELVVGSVGTPPPAACHAARRPLDPAPSLSLAARGPRRANGSIRFEFDWPSNGGLQRFAFPLVWVSPRACSCPHVTPAPTLSACFFSSPRALS